MKCNKWAAVLATAMILPGFNAMAGPLECETKASKISHIQGEGKHSKLKGQTVQVQAVVSAVMPELGGYFLVEEAKDWDSLDATSEGIFVADKTNQPKVGDLVALHATVAEFKDLTQLENTKSFKVCGSGQPVKSVMVSLPFASQDAMESLEGMPIEIKQSLTISENYNFTRFGQLLLSNGRLFQPTNVVLPGAEANQLAKKNRLNQIVLDDGSAKKNPELDFDVNHAYRVGNQVQNIKGVVHYSFGNYMIEPTAVPQFIRSNPRQPTPQLKKGELRIASFNVLNYFNGDGDEKTFPTQRGASSKAEFKRQTAKTIAAMTAVGADIYGLMEVENDGYGKYSAIKELTDNLVKASGRQYAFIKPGTDRLGDDAIAVGMIYDADKVEPVGKTAILQEGPFGKRSRLPMAQSFKQKSDGEMFTLVVNHFKSKGRCPQDKTDPDADKRDGQGCWNHTRTESSERLVKWLNTSPTGINDKDVLIIGDLNAYAKEQPVTTLEAKGYVNLIEKFQGSKAYSYVFRGLAGYLDHALASKSLLDQVVDTADWHINADEMRATDYNLEGKSDKQQKTLFKADAFRSSDHDPVIIELNLK